LHQGVSAIFVRVEWMFAARSRRLVALLRQFHDAALHKIVVIESL